MYVFDYSLKFLWNALVFVFSFLEFPPYCGTCDIIYNQQQLNLMIVVL